MKKSLFLNTVMLCAFILLSCSKNKAGVLQVKDPEPVKEGFDLDEASLKAEGYTKIYEEHFSADFSKWNIWEGGAYNNELQLYQGKNMTIKDGNLIITAKKEEVKGRVVPEDNTLKSFAYTSGRIESKALFTPDDAHPKLRISARIQLPLGGGCGRHFGHMAIPGLLRERSTLLKVWAENMNTSPIIFTGVRQVSLR